jgi:hypothetical protein
MNNPLRSAEDYELFLYTLPVQFPSVQRSTVTFVRRGLSLARVTGELYFAHDLRVVVRERILFRRLPAIIDWYGYAIWQGEEKVCWYDPQPHPNEPTLQSTHPHHKHIAPDIKHNRVPAPGMSFHQPNLPQIIREVEDLIQQIERENQ